MGYSDRKLRLGFDELDLLVKDQVSNPLLELFKILQILNNSRRWLATREIELKLKDEYETVYSRRSLQDHLVTLLAKEFVNKEKDGAGFKYKLANDMTFSTTKFSNTQLETLSQWRNLLETYDYIPGIDDLKIILERDLPEYEKENKIISIIDLPSIHYKGKEHIDPFFGAINEEQLIDFTYKKYKGSKQLVKDFMPYSLKEHNKRWYVVGKREVNGVFLTYAIDRVDDVKFDTSKDTFEREEFDSTELFQHSMGIFTSWQDSDKKNDSNARFENEAIDISFKVRDGSKFDNISYLTTNKIHPTQKVSKLDKEGWATIRLTMFPEADLIREIRGIGLHCVKDINPTMVNKWVREL